MDQAARAPPRDRRLEGRIAPIEERENRSPKPEVRPTPIAGMLYPPTRGHFRIRLREIPPGSP
jgi:hypothetical protein